MELVAPAGPVYQAGTLSGNPLAMTAGIVTLQALREPGVWDGIMRSGERLFLGIGDAAADADVAGQPTHAGTMFGFFFTDVPVRTWEGVQQVDTERFARFHREMLERGVYLPPSQFEVWFLSTAHGEAEIDATIAAARAVFSALD
jgi:glutamate-1-semialdehyde 2,1-aminomutase